MDRAKAKSLTRTVQIVAVGLVGAGVAAALVPLTGKVEIEQAALPPPPPKPPEAPRVEIDATAVAAALNTIAPPVKNQPAPVDATGTEPAPPVLTGIDAWRYLGAIISGSERRAVLVVNDQQRMLKVGQTIENVEVVQVERGFVKVRQGEVERQIDLAARQRPELTIIDAAALARSNAGARPHSSPSANPPGGGSAGNAASVRAKMQEIERLRIDAKRAGDARSAAALESAMTDLEGSLKESDGKGNK